MLNLKIVPIGLAQKWRWILTDTVTNKRVKQSKPFVSFDDCVSDCKKHNTIKSYSIVER